MILDYLTFLSLVLLPLAPLPAAALSPAPLLTQALVTLPARLVLLAAAVPSLTLSALVLLVSLVLSLRLSWPKRCKHTDWKGEKDISLIEGLCTSSVTQTILVPL